MTSFLIVDDSPHKVMVMQGMLHRHGWKGETLIASTTKEAKEMIDAQPIDFAFIDYYIPSENGPAIIASVKAKNPTARIALVSSSDKHENCEEARAAGAEICICTSYEADEVERMFSDVLREWHPQL
jgi:CheY-like chemotaxis protein